MTTYRTTIDTAPRATTPASYFGLVLTAIGFGGTADREGQRPLRRLERMSRPLTYSSGWPYNGR